MDTRLGFIDVGARGGVSEQIKEHRDRLIQVLVEPESTEAEALKSKSENGTLYRVIAASLGNVDKTIEFHETVNPFCSSNLRVNHNYLEQYEIHKHFAPKSTTKTACSRYDTLYATQSLPRPHLIKIDVQGFEHQVLQGMGGLLQYCLAIELETHFYPIYSDQRLFNDIVALLADYDMVLRKISNDRSPDLNGDYHFDMDLVEVNAIFTKSTKWARVQSDATRDDLNFACRLFNVVANR